MATIKAKFNITLRNGPRLVQRARFVFGRYCTAVFPKFQESIDATVYEWPNVTIRKKSGQPVGSPRNIVDTGAFKGSQDVTIVSATSCLYTWNVPYASFILTGYRSKSGQRLPPRDWISPVIEKDFRLDRYFEAEWKRLGF